MSDPLALPFITLDVDWAPDAAIDLAATILVKSGVRATWYVTHASPAIDRLRARPDLFELGIHPNFLPGSSHGVDPEAVVRHCLALVPEARSVRTHALVQSSPLLEVLMQHPQLETEASLYLPYTPGLRPVPYRRKGREFLRVPFFWEDDDEPERRAPGWRLGPLLALGSGLKVFAFHPIHVALNSVDATAYEALKAVVPRLSDASLEALTSRATGAEGTRTLFEAVVEHLAARGGGLRMTDLAAACTAAGAAG